MKRCYVTIRNGHHELNGDSVELSRFMAFDDFIKMVSQPNFFSITIQVLDDPVIPDHEITLMKV